MLLLHVQRICTRGPDSLPARLIVDVGAVLRWASEGGVTAGALDPVKEAVTRTHRRVLWAVTPTPLPVVDTAALDATRTALEQTFGVPAVLRSAEPLAAALAASMQGPLDVGIVTAGMDDRPHELALTDRVSAMLDVATGCVWTARKVTERFLPPALLPELYAMLGSPLDGGKIVNADRYAERLKDALRAGSPPEAAADLPPALRTAIRNKKPLLDELARSMRGLAALPDASARSRLAAFVSPPVVVPVGSPDTAYVIIDLSEDNQPVEVSVQIGASRWRGQGAQGDQLLRQAHATVSGRWFMPHAMDALGHMVDRSLPLPESAIDPGVIAHALHPDEPRNLVNMSMSAATLSTTLLTWLRDHKRKIQPPDLLDPVIAALPQLDEELGAELRRENLDGLVERDLGRTLPHLARLEREGGAWVGTPVGYSSWEQLYEELQDELARYERVFAKFLRIDPYRATTFELLRSLKSAVRPLPSIPLARELTAKQEFDRLVVAGCTEAAALDHARALQSSSGAYFWLKRLRDGITRLRGLQFPLATGRWGFRDLPLHNLPKRSAEGKTIRSGLLGPPGHVLVAADYNGFEVRLLAALSNDPVLVKAAQRNDIHEELAEAFFASRTKLNRNRAKIGVYSIVYGQTASGFWKSRTEMDKSDADALYALVQSHLAVALDYRDKMWTQYAQDRFITTLGGWRRFAPTRRKAFNTILQGLGADVLRWVLRRLGQELPSVHARLVHQAHDEVLVAVPPAGVSDVEHILEQTMTEAVVKESGLLPAGAKLRVNLRSGHSWGDLI
ncbi:DNA polymerase [Sorangium sp. So ce429]